MLSIFSPRVDIVATKSGEVSCKPYISPAVEKFDKYYIDYNIKFVPKLLEGTDDDYILEMKVIESVRDIVEVINSQADDVGLKAMLERFEKTGDPSVLPSGVNATDQILDLTQIPQDGAEYFEYIHGLVDKFKSLPEDLRKDMTLDEFVKNVSQQQVDAYLESKKPVDKKEGDNNE